MFITTGCTRCKIIHTRLMSCISQKLWFWKNQRFSGVFGGYKLETLTRNGIHTHKSRLVDSLQIICEGATCYGEILIQKLCLMLDVRNEAKWYGEAIDILFNENVTVLLIQRKTISNILSIKIFICRFWLANICKKEETLRCWF